MKKKENTAKLKDKYVLSGSRIRQEKLANKMKNVELGKLLNKGDRIDPSVMSKVFSGERHLHKDELKILAEEWNINYDYLSGESNYRTDNDRIRAMFEYMQSERAHLTSLLQWHGYETTVALRSIVSVQWVYDHWRDINNLLDKDSLSFLKSTYNFCADADLSTNISCDNQKNIKVYWDIQKCMPIVTEWLLACKSSIPFLWDTTAAVVIRVHRIEGEKKHYIGDITPSEERKLYRHIKGMISDTLSRFADDLEGKSYIDEMKQFFV